MNEVREASTPVVLTPAQQRIWMAQRLHPDVPLATMANRFDLDGDIASERFVAAFDRVVDHCDVLRMVVDLGGDRGETTARLVTRTTAATTVLEMDRDDVDGWVAHRLQQPIDASVCVYDSVLFTHPDDTATWWLALHHVATDAWASALIFEATAAAYEHGASVKLSDIVDGRYFDVALSAQVGADSAPIDAEPGPVALPDPIAPIAPYGPTADVGTAIQRLGLPLQTEARLALDEALGERYRSLSRDMSLLAIAAMGVAILVHRLDGRTTVQLDVPLHHRSSRAFKRVVGPTMELASLDVEVIADETHAAMFKRIVRSIMQLLHSTRPGAPATTRSGLLVNVVTAKYAAFAGVPTTRRWVRAEHADTSQLIGVQVFESPGEPTTDQSPIRWEVEIADHLSVDRSSRRLPQHLAAVVAAIIERPDESHGLSPLVSSADVEDIALLNPVTDSPAAAIAMPVHETVASALRADPEWIVAEQGGTEISASHFDRHADGVASWLVAQGVGRGVAVGIRLPRSVDALVAVHGVLRAGAAFVMLDPDDPKSRHDVILADAGVPLVIDALPPLDQSTPRAGPALRPTVDLDDLAYILFTSGSTGKPKGVPISHRGLADYLHVAIDAYGLDQPVVALHSSLVFDLTITSLFVSFLSQGRTVVFDQQPVEALAAIAADDRIDTLKATPSQLEIYHRFAQPGRALRTVIVGGEAFRRPVAMDLIDRCLPGVRIINEYGPTEAVVGCMIHEFVPGIDTAADIPIGNAAPGSAIAVLDHHLQHAPSGVWGELWVRRPGMSTGYLGRPDETARRFVDVAVLQDIAAGPWYRTGDRARMVRPGVLVYGGRMDDQIKVNGIRLEPAEVEAVLVGHVRVVSALVRTWTDGQSPDILVAWYRSADGSDLDADDLRAHVGQHLAAHAVPAAYVRVDEMPLASSAKADPSLLPAPGAAHRSGRTLVAPVGETEHAIAQIWCDVLGITEVSVVDDFFDIGGASLSAIEVVAALDELFGTDLADAAVFSARTVRALAGLVDSAIPLHGDRLRGATIEPLDPADPTPLSSSEEAMLFDHRRSPVSTHYNVARLYTIDAEPSIDLALLRQSFRDVVAHHETLHTSYATGRHVFELGEALSWTQHDATTPEAFDEVAAHSRSTPFDLDDGPLIRVDVARTGPHQWSLLLCLHHISLGVGTLDLIWEQVVGCYEGAGVRPLPVTYGAHAAWQRQRQDADTAGRAAWLERSARRPEPARLGLPTPPEGTPDGYLARRLDITGRDLAVRGFTPFASTLAAAAVAVTRFTAATHVEFGVAASTKDHAAVADSIGHHLNSLPIAVDVSAGATFLDLLEAGHTEITDTLRYRTYPFAAMVRDARAAGLVAPDLSFMLAYDEMASARFPDARVEHRILPSDTAVTDLTFFVQERPDWLQLSVEYRGSVLDDVSAERLLQCFESVLLGGIERPERTVAELTATERRSSLVGSPLAGSRDLVPHRIIRGIRDRPDTDAVVDSDGSVLLRRELIAAIASIGHRIDHVLDRFADSEPSRQRRVGVAVGRGLDVIPALLAAQFGGGIAVPLDPTVGRERLRQIATASKLDMLLHDEQLAADDAGARLGLAAERCLDVRRDIAEPTTMGFDEAMAAVESRLDIVAERTAYIIFTSGSTGTPRGVGVTHANLAASTFARAPWYAETPDRFLVTSSIGFDSSVVGLYWPLVDGGAVVFPSDDDVHDVDRLGALIERLGVSHLLMVPTLYRSLLDRQPAALQGITTAIVAGEACPAGLAVDHASRLPAVLLVNEYGPTEATVWATAHRVEPGDDPVPIGRPIPGAAVNVTGEDGLTVPVGVAGELWIAGAGVTPGYVDAPELTAVKFVEHAGDRWYRTGDRARLRSESASGSIEFVGRLDDQLNVGGVRIEPSEVEQLLTGWSAIDDAVVVAAGTPPSLVAHVASRAVLDEARLRAHLTARLPAAAVPRHVVTHDQLPLSSNGKIDRRAAAGLPMPAVDAFDNDVDVSGGPLVDVVLGAWRTALGRRDVALDTDFFDIGGDSLTAVEIVTRVGNVIGSTVPIADLLAGRTPEGMAARLADSDSATRSTVALADQPVAGPCHAITMQQGADGGPLILMVPAWDDVFGYQALADAFDDDIGIVALVHVDGPEVEAISTVDDLVEAFLPLALSATRGHRAIAVVGWSVGGIVAVELADALATRGDVDVLALVDTLYPGEDRHLWSNRWWKYKSLLAPASIGEASKEVRVTVTRRTRRLIAAARKRLARTPAPGATRAGVSTATSAATPSAAVPVTVRASGVFPPESLAHQVGRVRVPFVFYAATATNPDRTVARWTTSADDISVVSVVGRHRGFDSVMGRPGVDVIAADLLQRLS